MHILIIPSEHFITQTQPLGGIFQYHQAKALNNAGHQIGVLSVGYITPRYLVSKYIYKKEEKKENINIKREYKQLYFPHRYMLFKILKNNYIKMADKLYKEYIKEFGIPDIIHAHNFLYAGIIAKFIKDEYGVNYIVTEHSSSFVRNKLSSGKIKSIENVAKNALKVTAVSSSFNNILKEYTKTNIDLLPNIVDDFFFQKKFQNKISKNFIFLHIASLDKNKNQELLIKSFEKIAKLNHNVYLNIAGSGYMKKYLESLVKKLDIQKQVNFLGRISQEKVRDEMMKSNCFVLSSNFETFGVVLIEALACGLPLIATECGGPKDIVNKQNGILIKTNNQLELKKAMLYMYENSYKYDREKLRNGAKEKFGEKTFIENVIKYYKVRIDNEE
ncbi:glycosyltransferase [Aliarcobacter butzleri]|uniref:glycosyltransferase n=1 Tax=Aliarcobacter butzleri TaxID=28197 RepID=UPI001EE0CC8C|nr:glycosyltransferase [Aliarcobacter butzleri]MCG3697519.1 glycosyltransferase [Aliarcobacter butzleri]MCG3698961.1 glycosyltransferase [Aliarcobacter butzleri]MCG3717587.1 glycosyltransferase [Aliarcobacter butzleri]MCT7619686.1 glycosyltransferase [Aliarcobacter butzleri]MDN5091652.1 glycosyltransferase [Aliarcobacter butzleri]